MIEAIKTWFTNEEADEADLPHEADRADPETSANIDADFMNDVAHWFTNDTANEADLPAPEHRIPLHCDGADDIKSIESPPETPSLAARNSTGSNSGSGARLSARKSSTVTVPDGTNTAMAPSASQEEDAPAPLTTRKSSSGASLSRKSTGAKRGRSEGGSAAKGDDDAAAAPLGRRSLSAIGDKVERALSSGATDSELSKQLTKPELSKYLKENDVAVAATANKDALIEKAKETQAAAEAAVQPDATGAPATARASSSSVAKNDEEDDDAAPKKAALSRRSTSTVSKRAKSTSKAPEGEEEPSLTWTVSQLKKHASQKGIDLKDATLKADILKAVTSA